MSFRLVFLALLALGPKPPGCAVDPQPRITQPPMRYLRVRVTVEDRVSAVVSLESESGRVTSSYINSGPKTSWIEWKNIYEDSGDYEVRLLTASGCSARSTVEVAE